MFVFVCTARCRSLSRVSYVCSRDNAISIAKMFLMVYVGMIAGHCTVCSKMSSIVKMFLMAYVGMIIGHDSVCSRDNAIHC